MKQFTIYDDGGEILRSGYCASDDLEHQAQPGEFIFEGRLSSEQWYFSEGQPVAKPSKPSEFYAWDSVAKSWVGNIDEAAMTRKQLVDALRTSKDSAPIFYDNKWLDADNVAKENIQGKLDEINIAESLEQDVDNKVWWDVDNTIYAFDTIGEYKSWLQGCLIALSQRRTQLFIAARSIKQSIDDISVAENATVDDIMDVDITIGWPD